MTSKRNYCRNKILFRNLAKFLIPKLTRFKTLILLLYPSIKPLDKLGFYNKCWGLEEIEISTFIIESIFSVLIWFWEVLLEVKKRHSTAYAECSCFYILFLTNKKLRTKIRSFNILAPRVGLEPTTPWLTVRCSTGWTIG